MVFTYVKEGWTPVLAQLHCFPNRASLDLDGSSSAWKKHFSILVAANHLYHDQWKVAHLQVDELGLGLLQLLWELLQGHQVSHTTHLFSRILKDIQ